MRCAPVRRLARVLALVAAPAAATGEVVIDPPAPGSVSRAEGLAAWDRIYEVASHPRCANCHVGASDVPMWSGPGYGRTRPHGMAVRAGDSRIGAETIPCRTCHVTSRTGGIDRPHAAPQVADAWRLAPPQAAWFGRSSDQICAQLRDPARTDGRTALQIAEHLGHDVILHWAWTPGSGREPAPYSLQEHVNDVLAWGVAGQPCAFD